MTMLPSVQAMMIAVLDIYADNELHKRSDLMNLIAEYFQLTEEQKKIIKKIASFLSELEENPTQGTGQVERLKHYGERSVWSRRIDQKHRLVYEVFEEEKRVELLSAYGHYNDD